MTTKDLLDQALDLPRPERAALALDLLASLDEPLEDPADVETAWRDEIERRVAEVESGVATLVDWDSVRADLLARVGKR
jgi:putative addiction module component (TIGR02574 family)